MSTSGMLLNKVGLATGAANGVGRAVAMRMAEEGADVVVSDIDQLAGEAVVEEVEALGRKAHFIKTDMSSVESIRKMVAASVNRFGHIDLLSNNVGITRIQGLFDVTEQDWDLLHSVNAKGAFFCLQAVAQHMVERGEGRIVNTASIASLGYRDTTSIAYSASKASVFAMTRVAAHLLKDHGVSVNSVCPGPTHSGFVLAGMDEEVRKSVDEEALSKRMDEHVPIGRANTPTDVANVIIFLLSNQARNVNGSAYTVDGGIMLQ